MQKGRVQVMPSEKSPIEMRVRRYCLPVVAFIESGTT